MVQVLSTIVRGGQYTNQGAKTRVLYISAVHFSSVMNRCDEIDLFVADL